MKCVLYVGGFNLPDMNAAAQRVMANSKILSALGFKVILIGYSRDIKDKEFFNSYNFDCINLPYPTTFRGWVRMLTSINPYKPYINHDTVAVIAYNHPAIALKRFLQFNKKRGIKTYADCTEWYEPQGSFIFKWIKGWDINQRMNKVHTQLDGVVTISRYLDDFYRSKGVKTLLLPPLVDKQDPKWCKSGRSVADNEAVSLLYAGSPDCAKDKLDYVIDALNIVALQGKQFNLNIVGITEDQYRAFFLRGTYKSIPSFVHFWGRLAHTEVIKMLQDADFQIFIREEHLSNQAGFPTKFSETISAGTIVLTNASSNLKDYMIEGVNSFELDIKSEENLIRSLVKPLSLSKKEILEIKAHIDSGIFDYRNYINAMRSFLLNN